MFHEIIISIKKIYRLIRSKIKIKGFLICIINWHSFRVPLPSIWLPLILAAAECIYYAYSWRLRIVLNIRPVRFVYSSTFVDVVPLSHLRCLCLFFSSFYCVALIAIRFSNFTYMNNCVATAKMCSLGMLFFILPFSPFFVLVISMKINYRIYIYMFQHRILFAFTSNEQEKLPIKHFRHLVPHGSRNKKFQTNKNKTLPQINSNL